MFAAMQVVEYQPVRWSKGRVKAKTLLVSHYVVYGSATAGTEPELDSQFFKVGNQMFLLFDKGPGRFWKEASNWRSSRNPLRNVLREQDKDSPERQEEGRNG